MKGCRKVGAPFLIVKPADSTLKRPQGDFGE